MSTQMRPQTGGAPGEKPRMTPKSMLVWGAVAVVGAVCWGVLALSRGEDVSALWILFAALGVVRHRLPLLRPLHRLPGAGGRRHPRNPG